MTQELFYKQAGQRIMMLRLANNLSRERLAELSDISSKFLYEIETGKKGFSAYTLDRIAEALGVGSDYILSKPKEKERKQDIYSTIELFDEEKLKILNDMLELVYKMGCK